MIKRHSRGFTLVEMMVSITVFIIFTSIILSDYRGFGRNQKFLNFVYDVALNMRQVQTSGLAVLENQVGTRDFTAGYGIHISMAIPSSYVLFTDLGDINRNLEYDAETEYVRRVSFEPGYELDKICAIVNSVETTCLTTSGSLDIVFVRPNPDATIIYNGVITTFYTSAEITLSHKTSTEVPDRKIIINSTGQISIQ